MRILAVATFSVCSLAAALIAIAAIGTADFAMQGRSTAAFPVGETSAVKKVVKKKPIKKSFVPARAKKAEASPAKAVGLSLADAERFRAAGLEFRIWGVNDAELFAYAKSLKVAVFTCAKWEEAFEWAKSYPDVEIRP